MSKGNIDFRGLVNQLVNQSVIFGGNGCIRPASPPSLSAPHSPISAPLTLTGLVLKKKTGVDEAVLTFMHGVRSWLAAWLLESIFASAVRTESQHIILAP